MLLSTTSHAPTEKFPLKDAVKLIKEAGFTAFDISLFVINEKKELVLRDDYREAAKNFRKYIDELGIVCNQSHAEFPSSVGDPERDKAIYDEIVRDIEVAAILGAKTIVVHPKQHLEYAEHSEELFNMNVEFYKSLIPYCEKFGIKVALENMWQRHPQSGSCIDSTCSRAWEFCKYIDAINSEWIVGCLDLGHAALMGCDIPTFIKTLGNKRLQALHIHDVDGLSDLHTLPFTQKTDFIAIAKALGEIDYKGDFTYEADCFLMPFPKELYPCAERFMFDVAKYLADEIEKNRK